jgi:hypothetical protein
LEITLPVQVLEEPFRESASTTVRLHGISKGHLLEGEKHAVERTLLDSYCARGDLATSPRLQ